MHYDSLVSAHILSKPDALVDLTMTLKELEDGLVASLSQSPSVSLEENMEIVLFLGNLLLCILDLFLFLESLSTCLHLIDLVKLQFCYPSV